MRRPLQPAERRPLLAFGRLLRSHRRALGLAQDELAWWSQLSREQVSRLERGLSRTTESTIRRMAGVLAEHAPEVGAADFPAAADLAVELLEAIGPALAPESPYAARRNRRRARRTKRQQRELEAHLQAQQDLAPEVRRLALDLARLEVEHRRARHGERWHLHEGELALREIEADIRAGPNDAPPGTVTEATRYWQRQIVRKYQRLMREKDRHARVVFEERARYQEAARERLEERGELAAEMRAEAEQARRADYETALAWLTRHNVPLPPHPLDRHLPKYRPAPEPEPEPESEPAPSPTPPKRVPAEVTVLTRCAAWKCEAWALPGGVLCAGHQPAVDHAPVLEEPGAPDQPVVAVVPAPPEPAPNGNGAATESEKKPAGVRRCVRGGCEEPAMPGSRFCSDRHWAGGR